jgi:glutamyl-tRNA synthetase
VWVNGHFIRKMPLDELYKRTEGYWGPAGNAAEEDYKKRVLGLVQERLKYLAELPNLTSFFFEDLPADMRLIDDNKQLQKIDRQQMREMLVKSRDSLSESDFSQASLTDRLNSLLAETGQKPGVLFSLIRIATTWAPSSPGLAETLNVLGKDKSLERLDNSLQLLT